MEYMEFLAEDRAVSQFFAMFIYFISHPEKDSLLNLFLMQVCPDDWKSVAERELIEFGINSTLSSEDFKSNLDILDIFWSRLISSFSPVGGIEGFLGADHRRERT